MALYGLKLRGEFRGFTMRDKVKKETGRGGEYKEGNISDTSLENQNSRHV